MYFCQISKCFCLNLQNIFVSNCKMCYSQIAKCFGLKQQNQQNKLASAVFSDQFFFKLFFSLCTNSSAIWTGICGKSPVIELSQTAQWLSQCSLDHKMTVKITKNTDLRRVDMGDLDTLKTRQCTSKSKWVGEAR